ncbi:uncharacterized protein BROUX77_004921 [Berkeleyomyces rouxiae]|uniref:uncharacterized protein n=1 Tax=Berkeleyomyces rouxiae TaxID=2035830 RepID=UPI003B796E13
MAGTGKSTISRTICHDFTKCGQLGASFFFKRGEGDRGNLTRFVTTLATQLAQKYPNFAQSIRAVVAGDESIVGKGPRDQFEELIKEPLTNTSLDSHKGPFLVFVIDALDECDNDDDIKLIINLFSSCAKITNLNMKLKWLITSRPDLPIRLGFSAVKGTFQGLVLHEISPSFVERDISTFLKHELDNIKTEYNGFVSSDKQLSPDWPKAQSVEALTTKAIPLFIFAATICRFINDRGLGDPDDLLEQILSFEADGQSSQLDATYLPVLNNLIKGRTGKSKTVETF